MLGRFGRKADAATIREQAASALSGDMGLPPSVLPDGHGDRGANDAACRAAAMRAEEGRPEERDAGPRALAGLLGGPPKGRAPEPMVARGLAGLDKLLDRDGPEACALVLDCVSGVVPHRPSPPEDRPLDGHGAALADCAVLVTSEQVAQTSEGVLGLRDTEGYRRRGEMAMGGLGPLALASVPEVEARLMAGYARSEAWSGDGGRSRSPRRWEAGRSALTPPAATRARWPAPRSAARRPRARGCSSATGSGGSWRWAGRARWR